METTNKSHQRLSSQNSIYTIDGSQLQLAPPSEDMKGPKTKLFGKTSKKHLEAFLIFTILIISILLIALCVTIYLVVETKLGVTPYICLSHQCIRTASMILSSMNKSQDPCDNFYNFVCGNFRQERAAPDPNWGNSWFMINEVLIKRDITDFLLQKSREDDPEFVQKGRTLYNSCVDFSAMEENGFETYWDILNTTGLPKDPFSSPMSAEQWLTSLAKIRRYTGLNIILGVSVKESISNSSTNQIMFSTPDQAEQIFTGFHWSNENKKIMKESLTDDVKNIWVKSVSKIIVLVIKSGGGEIKKDELEASISSLVDLNRALWNVIHTT